ncbi:hypothetical protein I553_7722 [Mycobacterium xenopi 4042]|uniref:Uncharacterized protein n=1 Tax=Mycobacterium xenopi 4042 TaxID=1299334 RepID=X8AN59_MYCXE|nr:hypothetical protein I553_7722 [Mycobacterium xenopi 4042]
MCSTWARPSVPPPRVERPNGCLGGVVSAVTASGIPKAAGVDAILRLDDGRAGCIRVQW